jgi:hypothetical protein
VDEVAGVDQRVAEAEHARVAAAAPVLWRRRVRRRRGRRGNESKERGCHHEPKPKSRSHCG